MKMSFELLSGSKDQAKTNFQLTKGTIIRVYGWNFPFSELINEYLDGSKCSGQLVELGYEKKYVKMIEGNVNYIIELISC